MNTIKNIVLFSAVALGSTSAFGGSVEAGQDSGLHAQKTVKVEYQRGEVSTGVGRLALQERIEIAARKACGPTSLRVAGSVGAVQRNRACVDNAVARAMAKVPSSQVAQSGS